jgi:hypothetical protein
MTNLRALRQLAPQPANKAVEGLAYLVTYKPDATAPQAFIVGVIVQAGNNLQDCGYRVLQDISKFKCIYGHRIAQDDVEWALDELTLRIAHAAKSHIPASQWQLGSANFRIETGRYTSGPSIEALVSRAFEHAVVLAPSQHEKRFNSHGTASVRHQVAERLKMLAGVHYERFAVDGIPFEFNNRRGLYDVTHFGAGQVATVISGWSRSIQTLRTTLWHATADVSTCARAHQAEAGIFILFPTESPGIPEASWERMVEFVTDESAKLEGSSDMRVVAMPTPDELAVQVWEWYEPLIAHG